MSFCWFCRAAAQIKLKGVSNALHLHLSFIIFTYVHKKNRLGHIEKHIDSISRGDLRQSHTGKVNGCFRHFTICSAGNRLSSFRCVKYL